MNDRSLWTRLRRLISRYRAQLRFCLRMTTAGLISFTIAQWLSLPLHGLWMILTALVVTQMSAGASLRSTLEYIEGTLGGAVYAAIVGVLIPHTTPLAVAGVLALAIAPLAFAAAFNPNFRVAPFSAVLVLLVAGEFGEGPVESAITRSSEVALGGMIAVAVALFIFPDRAHGLGLRTAAGILERLARTLPELLAGFSRPLDAAEATRLQNQIGTAVTGLQQITAEATHEYLMTPTTDPDPGPLSRTLLRLRHDFVIIGRAAATPLPDGLRQRLAPRLAQLGTAASDFLRACAAALPKRNAAPSLDALEAALAAYTGEVAALRAEGVTRPLSSGEVEQVFTLGFALDQLHNNCIDLRRCVADYARGSRREAKG